MDGLATSGPRTDWQFGGSNFQDRPFGRPVPGPDTVRQVPVRGGCSLSDPMRKGSHRKVGSCSLPAFSQPKHRDSGGATEILPFRLSDAGNMAGLLRWTTLARHALRRWAMTPKQVASKLPLPYQARSNVNDVSKVVTKLLAFSLTSTSVHSSVPRSLRSE